MKYKGITIHKNKNCDTWYTRYRINNKQYYLSARTQKECYDKLKKALKQQNNDTQTKSITFIEWYDKWLQLYKIGKVKNETLRGYKTLLCHLPQEIKNKELDQIKLDEIITIIDNCKAERQKQNLYDLLNMLYKKAVDNEIIEKNLITKIEKPKHEKNHGQALTNEQQENLINACNKIKNAEVILIALYQGLRRGEVLGLTRDNIDFEHNTLTINKSFNRYNKFDTTKNKQSLRTMPLFDQSKTILEKYKNNKDRIFHLSRKETETIINKLKQISNITNLKMKDMRSTFITRCKELNIPKHIIQAWVGHAIGSTVTDTVYTKHNTEIDYKYINILNNTKFYSNSTQKKK